MLSHVGLARRLSLVTAAAALLLSGCGSGSSDQPPPQGPIVVDGVVDVAALQQLSDTQLAGSKEQQEVELARLDNAFERKLWTESGLEAELGGAAAADAAFAAHGKAITGQARASVAQPVVFRPAVFKAGVADPSIGEGLFGGALIATIGAEGIVTGTNDLKDGESGSRTGAKRSRFRARSARSTTMPSWRPVTPNTACSGPSSPTARAVSWTSRAAWDSANTGP